jgi:MFS family permease
MSALQKEGTVSAHIAPDAKARRGWYHGWNIVAACALSQSMANGLPVNAFTLFLQDWSVELHAPNSSLQLGLAALGIFSSVLAPFVGVLVDRKPARLLMGGGLLGIALFEIGISFVTAKWQFLALYILLLPTAVVFSTTLPANAVVSRWFVRRLGLAMGLTAFGQGLAGVVLPPLIAALLPLGWRTIWRMMGAFIGLVVVPIVFWVVRDRPTDRDGLHYLTSDHTTRPQVSHAPRGGDSGLGWREVLARKNFWLLVVVYLPMLALYGGCAHNLAPIGIGLGLSRQAAGALISVFSLSNVGSMLLSGLLSDRFGNRLPLAGLATATALGGIIVATSSNVTSLTIGTALVGVSGGMWPLLGAAIAREFGSSGVGRGFGMLTLFVPVIVFTPFIVAKVRETTGSYAPALSGLAVLTLAGAVACLLFMRERPIERVLAPASTA